MNQRLQSLAEGLRDRRVLVTGASGRIGRRLLEILVANGVEPRALYRNPSQQRMTGLRVYQGDLLQPGSLEAVLDGVDVVFHLASYGPAKDDPRPEDHPLHRTVTVEGTRNLLAAAQSSGVEHLLFTSSTRVIDGSASLYARSKREAESLVLAAGPYLETLVLRLAPVYGFARQGSVAQMIAAIDAGRFPSLPDFGERRSLVHVDDVIQALLLLAMAEGTAGNTFTVTDLQSYSSRQMYEMICAALGRKPGRRAMPAWLLGVAAGAGDLLQQLLGRPMPMNRERLEKLSASAWFDGEPLARETGYRPQMDLEKALPQIIREYRTDS